MYQLILRLLVTMCVYACCDPNILVWSPNDQDSSQTSHHFKKHSVGLHFWHQTTSCLHGKTWNNNRTTCVLSVFLLLVCLWCWCFFLVLSSSTSSFLWRIPASELPALARIPRKISAKCPLKSNLSAAFQKWRLGTPLINLTYCWWKKSQTTTWDG